MDMIHNLLILGIPELDERGFQPRGRNSGMCFYGKGGGGDAPQPDPMIGQAAMANAQLGRAWLNFAQKQFTEGNKRQAEMDKLVAKVVDKQLAVQDEANTWAREDRTRTKEVFQPIEDQFIETATKYDTPEKQAEAAAQARKDVYSSVQAQDQANQRQMAAMGVNPDSGRFAGVKRATDLDAALASAGAQNNARQIVRDKGLALKADAANLGRGLPSSTAAAYGIGTNSGNSAVANRTSANQNFFQNQGVMANGYQGNINANNSAANIYNNLYGNQLNAWNMQQQADAQSSAGIGRLVGTALGGVGGFMLGGPAGAMLGANIGQGISDRRLKTDIRKVGELDNGLALYTYRFKPEFQDKYGSNLQFGVMAQEVEKIIPEAVTENEDGYKQVDYEKVVSHGI